VKHLKSPAYCSSNQIVEGQTVAAKHIRLPLLKNSAPGEKRFASALLFNFNMTGTAVVQDSKN
jgi:hypothetical protein